MSPSVYFLLGPAGSGRRELLVDLLSSGLEAGDRPAVILAEGERPSAADAALAEMPSVVMDRWRLQEERMSVPAPADRTHLFIVADGRANPVDQIEAFQQWLQGQEGDLARILCVVDCTLGAQHPEMLAWYEACIHFSDYVFLSRRAGVENKWVSDFLTHFKKKFYPCVFEQVKDGHVKNPALVLEPEPRRFSHLFDDPEVLMADVDAEGQPLADPYLERRPGGRRVREVPDITRFV